MHKNCRILVLLIVLLVGCSSGVIAKTPTPTSTHIAYSPPAISPTPIEINQSPLTMLQAWGNSHVTQFPITFGDRTFNPGGNYGENTITDDGHMCGNTDSAVILTPEQLLHDIQSISLIDLHTGIVSNIYTLPPGYQGLTCAVTGPWVIWTQAYGNTYESFQTHWKIMALNRTTQELRLLDESVLPNGQPAPAKLLPYSSASNGTVVWTTYADNEANTVAVRYDLATQQKTILSQNASFPIISWPWVSWGDSKQQGIVFKNLDNQQQSFINEQPSSAAFDETSIVFSDRIYRSIILYPSCISPQAYIIGKGINDDFVQFPTLNSRLVTWDSNYSLFAFDRKIQRLVQIDGIFNNPNPYISSHYMVWKQPISPADVDSSLHKGTPLHVNLYIIDTNTLP